MLTAILTAILEPDVPIVSGTVLNPELPADVVGAKSISRVDSGSAVNLANHASRC